MAGIYNLDQLRSTAPKHLQGVSDEQLIVEYSNSTGQDPYYVAGLLGVPTGANKGDFAAGISSGTDVLQSLGISAVAGLADIAGAEGAAESLRKSAEAQQYEAYLAGKPGLERIEDVEGVGDFIDYAQYQLGKQVPIMAGITAAQFVPGLGQAASATGLARLGALAPRALGGAGLEAGASFAARRAALAQGEALAKSTMVGSGLGFGSLYEASGADGDPDPWAALALAPLYGAAEAAVPAALSGSLRMKTGGFTGNLVDRAIKGFATAGLTEAGTEVVQTGMEIALDGTQSPEEMQSALLNAAVAGGIVGGTMGGAGGAIQRKIPNNELGEKDLTAPTTLPPPAPTEQLEMDVSAPIVSEYEQLDETGAPYRGYTPPKEAELQEEPAVVADESQAAFDFEEGPQREFAASQNEILRRGAGSSRAKRRALVAEAARLEDQAERIGSRRPKKIKGQSEKAKRAALQKLEEQRQALSDKASALREKIAFIDGAATASANLKALKSANAKISKDETGLPVINRDLTEQELQVLQQADPTLYANVQSILAKQQATAEQQAVDLAETKAELEAIDQPLEAPVEETVTPTEEVITPADAALEVEATQEADSDTLIDENEYAEMSAKLDSLNKLSAEVQAQRGEVQGRVNMPKGVLAGIVRMLRDPKNVPVGVVYKEGTMAPDAEATERYLPQMRRVHTLMKQIIDLSQQANNLAANVDKGVRGESKRSDDKAVGTLGQYISARKKLAAKMDELVSVAGGAKNLEAIIAFSKVRNEKNRSATANAKKYEQASARLGKTGKPITNQREYEEINDVNLSSAFVEYKNGTLNELDVVRGTDTRRNFYERKMGVTSPLTEADKAGGIVGILKRVASFKGTSSAYSKSLQQLITRVFTEEIVVNGNIVRGPKAGMDVKVEFLEDNPDQANPNYDPNSNTIYIHREASQEEILHETLHAALQWYVYQNPESENVAAISEAIDDVIDFVDEGFLEDSPLPRQYKDKALEVVNILRDLRQSGNELDAVLEMISYGTTLREFREVLKAISSDPSERVAPWRGLLQDIWDRMVSLFNAFLGVENTAANRVLENTAALLDKAALSTRNPTPVGNRLDMSVISGEYSSDMNPTDSVGRSLGDIYRTDKGKDGIGKYMTTQILFDAVGLTEKRYADFKERVITEKVREYSDKIRKDFPRIERAITYFNTKFSVPTALRGIFDIYKEQRNSVYMVTERLASYVERQSPENITALMDYFNGDSTKIDALPNSRNLKQEADIVMAGIEEYVSLLPEDLQQAFDTQNFTDFLLQASNANNVASHSMGMRKIAEQIKNQGVAFDVADIQTNRDLFDEDVNGDLVLDGEFHEVIVKPALGKPYSLMVSKDVYERLDGRLPIVDGEYKVDTGRTWTMNRFDGKQYRFKSKLNYKEAMDAQKAKELANAMRNTVGGLANYYSSRNFFNGLASDGAIHKVVFDTEQEINDEFGTDLGGAQQVLEIKDESSETRRATRMSGTWVKIPDDAEQYGAIAGKIIHGPVFHAMRDMGNRKPLVDSEAYNASLRVFKKSKTIYNIGTHITNVASNVTLAMLHDIPLTTVWKAAELMYKYEVNSDSLTEGELAIMRAFMGSGAMLGNYSSVEVKKAIYENMAKTLNVRDENVMTRVTAFINAESNKGNIAAQLARRSGKAAMRLDEVATELYAAEDNVFRLAAFVKAAGDSQAKANLDAPTDEMLLEAGRFARQAFLDYDIDAPVVKFMRQSFMPFISWTYAITPVLGRIAANQPWKIANVLTAYVLIDMLTSSMAGDDDELRELGPERLDERMFGFGPRMYIRIPFLGDEQNPVYYRLGDYIPLASTAKGLPNGFAGQDWWPGGLTPGGPFVNAIIGMVAGVDPYTGDSIHEPTDGNFDKLINNVKFGYDLFSPPMARSSNIEKVVDAAEGKVGITGREPGVSNLIFSKILGLKGLDFNVDEQAAFKDIEYKGVIRDYKTAISKAKREELRRGYPDYEALDAEIESLTQEMYDEYNRIYKIEE